MEVKWHRVVPLDSLVSPDELQDYAAALYIKLRALQNNPDASAEASAAIHRWIGNDTQRQAAYDRVRKALYSGEGDRCVTAGTHRTKANPANPGLVPGSAPELRVPAALRWWDVVLLAFVFILLLPMIYFLAVPFEG